MEAQPNQKINLLSFGTYIPANIFAVESNTLPDGGGIRGISALIILDEIMKRIQYLEKKSEIPRPSEYFQLIGGTSTGGSVVHPVFIKYNALRSFIVSSR